MASSRGDGRAATRIAMPYRAHPHPRERTPDHQDDTVLERENVLTALWDHLALAVRGSGPFTPLSHDRQATGEHRCEQELLGTPEHVAQLWP